VHALALLLVVASTLSLEVNEKSLEVVESRDINLATR
jgi:hypothetical protein